MGRRGDVDRREEDAADREQRDRPQIEAELAPAHRDRGRIDDRRQDEDQDEIRRQLERRQARNQRKPDAGDHQQDRRRNLEPLGDEGDHRDHRQQQDQNLKRVRHLTRRPPSARMAATIVSRAGWGMPIVGREGRQPAGRERNPSATAAPFPRPASHRKPGRRTVPIWRRREPAGGSSCKKVAPSYRTTPTEEEKPHEPCRNEARRRNGAELL